MSNQILVCSSRHEMNTGLFCPALNNELLSGSGAARYYKVRYWNGSAIKMSIICFTTDLTFELKIALRIDQLHASKSPLRMESILLSLTKL